MAIREIPTSFIYSCDACGAEHEQKNASGHYANGLPDHWRRLEVHQHGYDPQGHAVADATIKRLLCPDCGEKAVAAVNATLGKDTDHD